MQPNPHLRWGSLPRVYRENRCFWVDTYSANLTVPNPHGADAPWGGKWLCNAEFPHSKLVVLYGIIRFIVTRDVILGCFFHRKKTKNVRLVVNRKLLYEGCNSIYCVVFDATT